MDNTKLYAIVALAGLISGYSLTVYFSHYYNRIRFRKRVKCLFGHHEPGTPMNHVGGRKITYCDWCGKKVAEYQMTVNEAKQQVTRRIY